MTTLEDNARVLLEVRHPNGAQYTYTLKAGYVYQLKNGECTP